MHNIYYDFTIEVASSCNSVLNKANFPTLKSKNCVVPGKNSSHRKEFESQEVA